MDKQEFERWFRDNLEQMAELGIMHFNSPWARTVRLSLSVNEPTIKALTARIEALEAALAQAASPNSAPVPKASRKKKSNSGG